MFPSKLVVTSFSSIKGVQKDFAYAVFFGLLSVILRFVQFRLPGYEDITSDLRDIPLLVAMFHIRNPVVVIIFGFFTLLSAPQVPLFSELALIYSLPHVAGLLFAWSTVVRIKKITVPDWLPMLYWSMVVFAYYFVFLIPAAALFHSHASAVDGENILQVYISIVESTPIEVIATALVTGLYLVQMNSKHALANQNNNLESILEVRTAEVQTSNEKLRHLNEELIASSEKIRMANSSLESMVEDRTKKINDQLWQLTRYAHMNSHDVRAPLARIMGLVQLLQKEIDEHSRNDIIKKLGTASQELDSVVKAMTKLLTQELPEEIQERKS